MGTSEKTPLDMDKTPRWYDYQAPDDDIYWDEFEPDDDEAIELTPHRLGRGRKFRLPSWSSKRRGRQGRVEDAA